jgi:hypothetical protein
LLQCELCRTVYVALKFLHADLFFNGAPAVQLTALTSIKYRNMLVHLLIAERAVATIWHRKYAGWQRARLTVAIIVAVVRSLFT